MTEARAYVRRRIASMSDAEVEKLGELLMFNTVHQLEALHCRDGERLDFLPGGKIRITAPNGTITVVDPAAP